MRYEEFEDRTIYRVIISQDEQYSVWPADREPRCGWKDAGKTGTHRECIDYIKSVWSIFRSPALMQPSAGSVVGQSLRR